MLKLLAFTITARMATIIVSGAGPDDGSFGCSGRIERQATFEAAAQLGYGGSACTPFVWRDHVACQRLCGCPGLAWIDSSRASLGAGATLLPRPPVGTVLNIAN